MWSNLQTLSSKLLQCPTWIVTSKRTGFVLERMNKPRLNKLGAEKPKKLRRKDYYYRVLYRTDFLKKPDLDFVLLKDVPGIGMAGEKIQMSRYTGYTELLLPRLAVYADSVEAQGIVSEEVKSLSTSKYSKIVESHLTGRVLGIIMNPNNPWTLQPWHVKVALRCDGLIVEEKCIKLPDKEISGPSVDVENKDFPIQLIMNETEKFYIRSRIFQATNAQSLNIAAMLKYEQESLFPEHKELIDSLKKIEEEVRDRLTVTAAKVTTGKKKKKK